jgi:hypothetical protein
MDNMVFRPCAQLIKHCTMKTYGGVDVQIRVFLTSVLDGREWPASSSGRLIPKGKNTC